jgi:predicted transcriptional regulator
MMTLHDVKVLLDAEVLAGQGRLDMEVNSAFGADLMSDVLAFGKPGSLLLTRITSPQVIRTSDILDLAAVILVRGKVPAPEVIQLAEELRIPVLMTRYVPFEAVGRLYEKGLRSPIDKVDACRVSG